MSETTFLAGKVLKQTLPVLPVPTPPGAPTLRRLLLPQGELASFYDAGEGIRYMAYIELRAGAERGNHYHKAKQEFVYVIHGELVLVVEDIKSKVRESVPMRTGDLAFIRPGVAHALRTLQPGHAIEFSKERFDLADIHKYPLS
jgi:mannose-6-phosphate isomerase-like protein (cupin superfamily)